MFRTFLLSFMVVGALSAMKCNGNAPLRDLFGMEVTCKPGNGISIPPQALPNDAMTYMMMAAAGDLFEIQSGQIALVKGGPDVRAFGQMLINDHSQTTSTLKAAALAAGLIPPAPVLNSLQQQMISELQLASVNFDQIFWRQQVIAHKMALDLQSNYAANGDVATLRGAAASAVPIVQMHLNKATASMSPMMGGACPANYWCNSDFDMMGMSFSVCCPSNPPIPSVSFASPYFSASFAPAAPATYYYTPIYSSAYTTTPYYTVSF